MFLIVKTTDTFGIKLLWILHLMIVVVLVLLFFVPKSLVPHINLIHLLYTLWVALSQIFWGIIMVRVTKRFSIVCPLTTMMQYLRGYKPTDIRNYDHSFIVEVMEHYNVKLQHQTINILMYVVLGLVIVRFMWLNY
jgi:hypothetical protein